MNELDCRRCGVTLTEENARTYQGRWIGACRSCESVLTTERREMRGMVRARGECRACGLVRSLKVNGTVYRHHVAGAVCPGSGDWPL